MTMFSKSVRLGRSSGLVAIGLMVVGVCLTLGASVLGAVELGDRAYARVDIDGIGFDALARIQRSEGVSWWIEAEDRLLVLADKRGLELLADRWDVEILDVPVAPERLALVNEARDDVAAQLGSGVDVLVSAGRMAVVQAHPDRPGLPAGDGHGSHHGHATVLPFEPGTVLARQWVNSRAARRDLPGPNSLVEGLVSDVQPDRWLAAATSLAGFNRYTFGSEVDLARDWLVDQFEDLPGLSVTTQSFQIGVEPAHNVMATWTGTSRPDDWYIVGAHYDSISQSPFVAAPGAEDNASGCAGVLELARVLVEYQPPATVVFVCYSGEEQGLWGSKEHVQSLIASGDAGKVRSMVNMDMIGYTGDPDLDCLIETDPEYSEMLDTYGLAAQNYTDLRIVTSLEAHSSDHMPFINEGIPALLVIENDWATYPHYHRTTDLPDNLSLSMGGQILRMNAAVLADVTGVADGESIFADGFESGDMSSWANGSP